MNMSIQVKLLGLLADVVGKSELQVDKVSDTDALKKQLLSDFPSLANKSFIVAVKKQIVRNNQKLEAGDEVALLPPFAGG